MGRVFQVKVMKYQDELEAGRRSRKPEFSIAEQVQQYRRKQLRKVTHSLVITCHFSHSFTSICIVWTSSLPALSSITVAIFVSVLLAD